MPSLIIDPHQIFQLVNRCGERGLTELPPGHAVTAHLDYDQWGVVYGLLFVKHPDLGALNETVIIGVQAETDEILEQFGINHIAVAHRTRPGSDIQTRFDRKPIMFELDFCLVKCDIRTPLYIGDTFARIVEWLAVHRDPHKV